MMRLARVHSFWLLVSLWACTTHQTQTAQDVALKEQLRPPATLSYDFMWRQRVSAEWPTGKQSFEAVLQKRDGVLTMLGLSPMGLPGFVLTLRADGSIGVENRMGRELPFEPAYILADVQRVFFPWLPAQATLAEPRSGEVSGLSVREQYRAGRLASREFRRSSAPDAGAVRVTYDVWQVGADAPERVTLANGWYRYRLIIETFEQTRLE